MIGEEKGSVAISGRSGHKMTGLCAEVVVHRMFAVFLNSLNGKNSSKTIVRDIFSSFFLMLSFKIGYREYFLSHRLLSRNSGL